MAGATESTAAEVAASTGDDRSPPRVANEEGLLALEAQMHQRQSKRARRSAGRSRRSRRIHRAVTVSVVIVLVLVVGGAGYAYYLTHGFHRVEVKGLHGALTTGKEAGTENILMVGSTSRCALKVQNPAYGLCSEGVNGVNSDVIMILHADPTHHRLALLSIPRDLFIPNARAEGPDKIDAGLYEGLTQLVSAIEEDFGIPIQHAVSLNFDQFANVVDALQGINMAFPISVFDRDSGLNVQAATCVHLNGTQALQVVRSRHLQYKTAESSNVAGSSWTHEAQSDLARIRRDHEFLRVLATAVAKRGLDNPISDTDLINSVKSDLTFDQSWSVGDMANLVLDFHSVNIGSVPQLTLPVAEVLDPNGPDGDLIYNGSNRQQVEFPAEGQGQSTIDQVLGISAATDAMTGTPLPAPAAVTVSVENGTGAYNQATDTSAALAALGFHMVGAGDTPPTGDVAETVVYYGSHTPATEASAEAVARSMTGSVIMAYDPSQVTDSAQVTVVTGSQFAVNAPTTTTTTGAAGSATTTTAPVPSSTTSTTSAASGAIAAPSSATSKLQPWDPRACPAGATATVPAENPT
jgi:LCP family protein required for cell wall assembly